MAVEFKNSNQFRSYPFLDNGLDSSFSRGLSRLFVDVKINLYTDLIRNEGEIYVAGISSITVVNREDITLELMIAGGVRDSGDNIIVDSGSGRRPIILTMNETVDPSTLQEDPEYITFWVYFDSLKADTTPTLFDKGVPSRVALGEDDFSGSEFVVSGYISISKRELLQLPTDTVSSTGMLRFSINDGVVIQDTSACFEDAVLNNISSQMCRRILLANKEPIPAPGSDYPTRSIVETSGEFNGDVTLHSGINCNLALDPANSKITITPLVGAGDGEACNEYAGDAEEELCNELVFAINGLIPDAGGAVNLGSTAPLQISQFNPSSPSGFPTDWSNFPSGVTKQQFWDHCLVFRIGDWGNSDNTPCESSSADCDP